MPQDPVYPPHRTWQFPPPAVNRRWKWIAIAATVLATLGLGAAGTALYVGESSDAPGLIDDVAVLDVIESACGAMTTSVQGLPPGESPEDRAFVVSDQNDSVERMIARIERIDADVRAGDRPLDDWLDDWRALVEARAAYGVQVLRDGNINDAEVEVPTDADGDPITDRMDDALLDDVCRVPPVLIDPASASNLPV